MLTVACVKAKPAYDHHYVNRLYEGVKRNLSIPHKFVCLTDDNKGLKCESRKFPAGLTGWWAKMSLFKMLKGPVFYLDLDSLILGNLDFIADYQGDFAILRDFYRHDGLGSGVMLWSGEKSWIWDQWIKAGAPNHPLGDQGIMEIVLDSPDLVQDIWPDKFVSYKVHCSDNMRPKKASVMCFHGYPKQEDFPPEHWISKEWKR